MAAQTASVSSAITVADKEGILKPLRLTALPLVLPLRSIAYCQSLARLWQRFARYTVPIPHPGKRYEISGSSPAQGYPDVSHHRHPSKIRLSCLFHGGFEDGGDFSGRIVGRFDQNLIVDGPNNRCATSLPGMRQHGS